LLPVGQPTLLPASLLGTPFPAGTFARMRAVRAKGETKTDLVRLAVERELVRRELAAKRPRKERR
jgi:hypothetical protein